MRFQERFYCRKKGTLDWKTEDVAFGMFGLYGRLDVFFDGFEAARNARKLDQGYHVYIGDYEVYKDQHYNYQ